MKQAAIWSWAGCILLAVLGGNAGAADEVSSSQRRAAEEYLSAAASGSPQALTLAIHPSELDRIRVGVIAAVRDEATRGGSAVRARLFGAATSLSELERLTSTAFFTALGRKLQFGGRPFASVKSLAAVADGKDRVHVIVRGKQPDDRGETEVLALVTLLPYGKDWKAAVSSELEAQIEDLIAGHEPVRLVGGSSATTATRGGASATPPTAAAPAATGQNSPEILALLGSAEKSLVDGRCDAYYKDSLSPNFRRSLSGKALDTLITNCRNSIASRELLIAALRVVRRASPRYEFDGQRASYDVSGQGLPFDQFVLERLDGRWYVAE